MTRLIITLLLVTSTVFADEAAPVPAFQMTRDEVISLIEQKQAQYRALQSSLDSSQLALYDNSGQKVFAWNVLGVMLGFGGIYGLHQEVSDMQKALSALNNKAGRSALSKPGLMSRWLPNVRQMLLYLRQFAPNSRTRIVLYSATVISALLVKYNAPDSPPALRVVPITEDEKKALESALLRINHDLEELKIALQEIESSNITLPPQ